jgi:hypothetical protein
MAVTAWFFCGGCGGAKFVNTAGLPDNSYCNHMKDICKEAREFEARYGTLSPEEKKDAITILKAYRLQCNDALDACRKSAE